MALVLLATVAGLAATVWGIPLAWHMFAGTSHSFAPAAPNERAGLLTLALAGVCFSFLTSRWPGRRWLAVGAQHSTSGAPDSECRPAPPAIAGAAIEHDAGGREMARQSIQEQREAWQQGIESAPASIASFDRDMCYLAASRRHLEDYGLTGRNVLGRSLYEILPGTPEHWRAIHQRCLAGAVEHSSGEPFPHSGGGVEWVRWEIQPWRKNDGGIGGIVLFSQDITPQKHAEEEILRLNDALEQRVRERTEQLEAANRDIAALAYSVSHDLRAPLRGIDGWSKALLLDCEDQLDARAREYLGRVRAETKRLGGLIDEMLRLSRIAQAPMHRDAVDLTSLANAVASRLRETAPERDLEFRVESGLTASGDARLLEIALTSLLDNAVKFTGPRSHARIEFGRQDCRTEKVFCVRDNGVGFDMAYAGMLFGAFQRLHKASEFPGVGIGLATAQRVIRRHGGRIWADAQPEKGAAFYFTIGGQG